MKVKTSKVENENSSNVKNIADQIDSVSSKTELSNPDEGLDNVEKIINRIVEFAGVTVLTLIVTVVFFNAVSRYTFNYSFAWAEEIVQMAMPWLAMTGVFLAVRRRTMIRIDFFFEKIPTYFQFIVAYFGYALNVVVLGFFAWVSLDFVRLFGGDVALYVEVPVGWSTSALVLGAAGAAIAYLVEFYRELRSPKSSNEVGGEGI
jgi:TRAP-type transport system small permease protein